MEKEFVEMKIDEKKSEVIKLDPNDDFSENICSIQDDMPLIPSKIKKNPDKCLCYKCKSNKSNFLNRSEFICKNCFLKIINHKFRSNLRAHCKIKHEDYVLVCVSGGNNSMGMLHWFYSTFNDNSSNRKLFFKLKVIFIDDSILLKTDQSLSQEFFQIERETRKQKIETICQNYNFPFEVLNIEKSLEDFYQNTEENFLDIYNKVSKIGSFHDDFNLILIRNIIFKYSIQNNFNKVVFGNTAQSLVNSIFGHIVKGRGYNLREDLGYIDDHFLNARVSVLKPLRDFLTKEILLYNYLNNVQLIYSSKEILKNVKLKVNLPKNGNTTRLIHDFFDNLQDKMSSTITTVIGTAEKLKLRSEPSLSSCGFCLNYLDQVYNELEIGSIDSIKNEYIFYNLAKYFRILIKNFVLGVKECSNLFKMKKKF